jgi:U32 family peptidase
MVNKPELLAPAGDFERLKYALAYGADAVYAGAPAFSLRARENGFHTLDDLAEGIRYCHAQGRKFYLAANVIARNTKIEPFQKSLLATLELKPDALIVADPGIIGWLRKVAPQVPLHLSVQANTTNYLTAGFWADLGISRVILSRELRLAEMQEIRSRVPGLELEAFVHGAVCMAMSGRCMLSDWTAHRDANQGACNNSCRMPYRLFANAHPQSDDYRPQQGDFELERSDAPDAERIALDEDSWGTYFMNSRDLCNIDRIPELVNAGLDSFKIEGRTHSIFYLSAVVFAYRRAIDAACAGEPVPDAAKLAVGLTDSRGRMSGLFNGPVPQNYETTKVTGTEGQVAALVRSLDATALRADVLIKSRFSTGDEIAMLTPGGIYPCEISSMRNFKGEPAETLHPGTTGSVSFSKSVISTTKEAIFAFLVRLNLSKAPASH